MGAPGCGAVLVVWCEGNARGWRVYSLLMLPLERGEQWGYLVEVVCGEIYN